VSSIKEIIIIIIIIIKGRIGNTPTTPDMAALSVFVCNFVTVPRSHVKNKVISN
jgi:hypothetical protein